ncbi:MAG TPA: hypothetical protein VF974_03435 [Patescibacteria group bacterium]
MDNLIRAVLSNYVPTVIIICFVAGIFVLAIAGIIRNSGRHDDIARSNFIIQTTIVGFVMLFVSGAFVFAFHQAYVSRIYSNVKENVISKLPTNEDINNTDLLNREIRDTQNSAPEARCILIVVDTIDCVKKTINSIIGALIEKLVRGLGEVVGKMAEKLNFNFLFNLPAELFDKSSNLPPDKLARITNFNNLLKVSEIIGLAWVYLLVVTHYFKAILFSLDEDYSSDFVGDTGKMLLGFGAVFLARYMAEAVILTAQSFASFLFSSQLASGLIIALKALIASGLWESFTGFSLSLVGLAIFVLIYIILFGFIVFKNAKRYFILLIMILLAPIFTPMLFFEMTRNMGTIFWNKFIVTSFSLMFDLLILLMIFVFLSSGGLSLSNLLLMLIGMAVVADSNNLIQQIANASEVAGFRSVVRSGVKSGAGLYSAFRRLKQ